MNDIVTRPEWRWIRSGACPPADNMAIDEAILMAHGAGFVPPTVRFYGWNPPTLTIGYFQKAREEVNFDALKERGFGFVRRPTGGRAVLHDAELTYSIVVSEQYPGMPRSVNEAYRVLSEGLVRGFRNLGFRAEMADLSKEGEKGQSPAFGSAACFDSPSWYELVVEGRKIAGSAQMRHRGVILQHGSILLDLDVDALFDVLQFPSERVRRRMQASFADKAVAVNDLQRALGRPSITLPQAEEAFRAGMEAGLGIRLVPGQLTAGEKETASRLVRDKYGTDAWNDRR